MGRKSWEVNGLAGRHPSPSPREEAPHSPPNPREEFGREEATHPSAPGVGRVPPYPLVAGEGGGV